MKSQPERHLRRLVGFLFAAAGCGYEDIGKRPEIQAVEDARQVLGKTNCATNSKFV